MGNFLATLRERDPHNQSIAVILCILFAQFKHFKFLSILHQYTFWNVTLCLSNFALRLEYERILFCNSMGIFGSYRTASADEQVHNALVEHTKLDPIVYFFGDTLVHFMPAVILGYYLVSRQKFVRPQHGWFAVLGQVYFAYSQAGGLDVSGVYRPHDAVMAWATGVLSSVFSPFIINNLIKKRYYRAIIFAFICFLPLFSIHLQLSFMYI